MNRRGYNRVRDTLAYIPIPKDLTRVKTKVALNLTKRQIVCFGLAAVVGVPTYLFTKGAIGNSAAVFLMIGLMLPFFFFAMYERDGQPAEKILRNILRAKLWPGVRPYKTENLYKYLQEEVDAFGQNKTQEPSRASRKTGRRTDRKARHVKGKAAR